MSIDLIGMIMSREMICEEIIDIKPSAWKGHRSFAKWLVETIQPAVIVDLGVDYGHSSFYLAIPNIGTIYAVDTFDSIGYYVEHTDNYKHVNAMKEKYNFDNIVFIQGLFDDVAKTWSEQIDILHIDGDHSYELVKHDYETWKKFLKEGSVIMFHDTESFPDSVGRFFRELEMPHKCHFKKSAGLGVASTDPEIIELIKNTFNI